MHLNNLDNTDNGDNGFNINDVLDKAVEEQGNDDNKTGDGNDDEGASRIAMLEKQLEELKGQVGKPAPETEEPKKEEPKEVDPTQLQQNMEETNSQFNMMKAMFAQNGLADLTGKYPELMANKDIMDKPVMPGTTLTAKEYMTELLSAGNKTDAERLAESLSTMHKIGQPKPSEPVAKGSAASARPPEMTDEQAAKAKELGTFFKAMGGNTLQQFVKDRKTAKAQASVSQ